MKLRKESWQKVPLGNYCDVRRGDIITKKTISEGTIPVIASAVGVTYYHNKSNRNGEIITVSASGVNAGYVNFFNEPIFASDCTTIQPNSDKIDIKFIFNCLSSLQAKIMSFQRGTAQAHVYPKDLISLKIPLPPLAEQKQIAALFQSIETAMEKVEGQVKNLKALRKRLIDEFVSDKPKFGNLLKGKKLKTYNYCDVTEKLMRKIDPLTYCIERIVAGENLESEDFKIRTWQKVGEGYLGPAFHVLFKAGDILYGSRRTYLRKVSHADFDGVCANTTYVIRANEELLLQDLLKHIMLSERFTQYSIGVSKGSTNPYINWKDLDNFSFQVPDLETQKEIANVLDGILEIVEQLKQQKTTLKHLKQKLLNEILG